MMLPISSTFFLTHDDHLPHNTFASVARRCSDRLQLGMSDFLRRNPQLQFEAVSRLDPEEKKVIRSLLDSMILRHEAKRWSGTG
jgi:hypothetical protein